MLKEEGKLSIFRYLDRISLSSILAKLINLQSSPSDSTDTLGRSETALDPTVTV